MVAGEIPAAGLVVVGERKNPAKAGATAQPLSVHPLAISSGGCSWLPTFPVLQLIKPFALREHEELQLEDNMQNQPQGPSWLLGTVLSLSVTQNSTLGSSSGCFSTKPTPAPRA